MTQTLTAEPAAIDRLLELIELGHEVPQSRWPRHVLTVCQVLGDLDQGGPELITLKRKVFECVATGNTMLAIRAMIPDHYVIQYGSKQIGAFASLRSEHGPSVRTIGANRERALLAAVLELAVLRQSDGTALFFGVRSSPAEAALTG
jgi:hypothetical protein